MTDFILDSARQVEYAKGWALPNPRGSFLLDWQSQCRAMDEASGSACYKMQVDVRVLLTHPIDEHAARFYLRFGFEASPVREQQLLLLRKNTRRQLVPCCNEQTKVGTPEPSSMGTRHLPFPSNR